MNNAELIAEARSKAMKMSDRHPLYNRLADALEQEQAHVGRLQDSLKATAERQYDREKRLQARIAELEGELAEAIEAVKAEQTDALNYREHLEDRLRQERGK